MWLIRRLVGKRVLRGNQLRPLSVYISSTVAMLPGRFCVPEAILLAFHIVRDLHSTNFVFRFHKSENLFSPMTAANPAEAKIA